MEPLIDKRELQGILERGLLTGKWSTLQFNKKGRDVILPSPDFLAANPQFENMELRDMEAFRKHHG